MEKHAWVIFWYQENGDYDPLILGVYERLQDAEEDHIDDRRDDLELVEAKDRLMIYKRDDEVFKIVNPPVIELGSSLEQSKDSNFPQ